MKKYIILIPIYNDRESLTKLIEDINFEVKDLTSQISIIVVNDASSQQVTDNYPNTENINSIEIIALTLFFSFLLRCRQFFIFNSSYDFLKLDVSFNILLISALYMPAGLYFIFRFLPLTEIHSDFLNVILFSVFKSSKEKISKSKSDILNSFLNSFNKSSVISP